MSFKQGDRVRVTYEAEYEDRSTDGWVTVRSGTYWPLVPPDATIEVLPAPQPEELKALGSVVEVDGERYVVADDAGALWMGVPGGDWFYWTDLTKKGPITVLFDPDARAVASSDNPAQQPDRATDYGPPKMLVDKDGDSWYYHEVDGAAGYTMSHIQPGSHHALTLRSDVDMHFGPTRVA